MYDLDLVKSIEPRLSGPYETALKFANAIPDYSLLQYRELAYLVCRLLAEQSELLLESSSLHAIINQLHEAQLINAAQRELLHRLRILGNQGAHKSEKTPRQPMAENTVPQQADQRLQRMREDAVQARVLFLEMATDLYSLKHPNKTLPALEQAPVGEQDHKEVLYAAVKEDRDWQAQFEAGLTYERLAEEYSNNTGVFKTTPQCVHWTSLVAKAIASYEAAWKQSAIDTQMEPEMAFVQYDNPDRRMAQLCKLEPLYHCCRLGYSLFEFNNPNPETEWSRLEQRYWKLLLRAADRDHPGANTLVGKTFLYGLPGKQPELPQAARYLKRAHKLGAEDVHLQLFRYYSDEKCTEFDVEIAIEYLRTGEENGCVDCQYELGMQYFHGEYIDKDVDKAREMLELALAKGHRNAAFSLDIHFGDLLERVQQEFADQFDDYELTNEPFVRAPKVGRNDPCPCGSGSKYKKCCGGVIKETPHELPLLLMENPQQEGMAGDFRGEFVGTGVVNNNRESPGKS